MRHPILTRVSIMLIFVAAVHLAGCAPGDRSGSAPTSLEQRADVATQLRTVFGERLGNSRIRARSVIAEVDGDVTDAELFTILLSAASNNPDEPSVQLILMPKGDGSTYLIVDWTRASGRLVRMRGEGSAQTMLATLPPGVGLAQGYTVFPDGGIAAGVDEAAMQSYASGKQVPWDESVK